jgi:predicted component of type VI protein secretion system
MTNRNEKINAIVADAKRKLQKYEEIQEAYDYMCEQYPENKEDKHYLEQTIRDFIETYEDEKIDELYEGI